MKNFVDLYGHKSWSKILADDRPVSIDDSSLHWLDIPDHSFIEYVTQRQSLPFESVPPNEREYKKQPTFMIVQVHRLWVTLQVLKRHLVDDQSSVLLDLGAFPFSLDIILREFLDFSGQIKATINLPVPDDWRTELDKRGIEVFYANLDPYVIPNIPDLPNYLDCEDNSIDFILFAHVIEHLYHPLKLFEEVYRVLKPGGKVLVSTDNAFMLHALINLSYLNDFLYEPVEMTSAMAFHAWRGHNRFFSEKDLATMLKKVGLEVIESNFFEVYYSSFIKDYFHNPTTHIPQWRAEILTEIPHYRNEIIITAQK